MENKPGRLRASDGESLFYQSWVPDHPEMVIALVHGLGGHSGRFKNWAEKFCKESIALASFDLRGHGLSDASIRRYSLEIFLDDIGVFLNQVRNAFPDIPAVLYGHSLGGNLAANYVLNTKYRPSALIITSPWFKLSLAMSDVLMHQLEFRFWLFNRKPPGIAMNKISRDPEVIQQYESDPLVRKRLPLRMLYTFNKSGRKAVSSAQDLSLPVLIMHGTSDGLTSPEGSASFYERAGQQASLKLWDGLYHELHSEPEKDQVFGYMIEWLNDNVKFLNAS
jgi:acylglycerol lipase